MLSSAAAGLPGLALAEAPADMSKANGALAAAMRVAAFPTVTTFRSMQVGGRPPSATSACRSAGAAATLLLDGISVVLGMQAHRTAEVCGESQPALCHVQVVHSSSECSADSLAAALAGLALSPGQRDSAAGSGTPAAAHANGLAPSGRAEPAAGGREQGLDGAAGASGSAEGGSSQGGSVFDPLSGSRAKSGATRVMPGGATGYYWWARPHAKLPLPARFRACASALFHLHSVCPPL